MKQRDQSRRATTVPGWTRAAYSPESRNPVLKLSRYQAEQRLTDTTKVSIMPGYSA